MGLPQATLINGKGFYGDCALIGGLGNVAGVATVEPECNVTTGTVAAGKLLLENICWPAYSSVSILRTAVHRSSNNKQY